jgi:outer membrane receptor protein involved in Fe transport
MGFAWQGTATAQAPADDTGGTDAVSGGGGDTANEQEEEVIVVTGSVIERKEYTTPAPVSVLSKEELDASGMVSIGEVLQNLPSQANAINVQFNNGGDGSTRISLRSLGAGRTLVLLNGRRHVTGGTGANASVDLNAIPMAIIKRVEVLKDGASAVYGSDAIAGVVNLITRDDFEGSEGSIYTGTTTRGGGTVYDLSVITGINSKKGNVIFAAGYYEQKEIMAGERSFSKTDKFYDWQCVDDAGGVEKTFDPNTGEGCIYPLGSTATPEGTIIDRLGDPGNAAWQDLVAANPSGVYWREGGAGCSSSNQAACWTDFNDLGNSDTGEGSYYNYQPENYLLTPQRRWNVYSAGHYKFTDKVSGFFETSYMKRRSDQKLAPTPLFIISEGLAVSGQSVYNPFGRDFIDIRRRFTEAGTRNFLQNIDTFRTVTGLKGDLPKMGAMDNWKWQAYYNFGRTEGTDVNEGRFIRSRLADALGPSFIDPGTGQPTCGTPMAPISGCVPINLLGGPGTITNEMVNYLEYTGVARGFSRQYMFNAEAGGRLAKIGDGGDVSLAVGVSYRDEAGGYTPDPITASGDTTGNKAEATGPGGYDVREGFAEISIVPVVGKSFAKWIELTGAVRAFDYNNFGSDFTYKVGALYKLPQGVAVRGTYSTAFRAPSIGELYAGVADSFPGVSDPCDTSMGAPDPTVAANCAADGLPSDYVDNRTQLKSRVGGNRNLDPETAKIFTTGIVIEPKQVKGLAFTLDYFWIDVDQAITSLGAGLILSNCYTQSVRTDCDKVIRNSSGFLVEINDTATNAGGSKTSGIDFGLRYDHTTGAGRFRHSFEGTWLQKFNVLDPSGRLIRGKGVYDLGVNPSFKANFSTQWAKDQLSGGLNIRYIGGITECEDDDCQNKFNTIDGDEPLERDVDANVTADLFVGYSLKSSIGRSMLTVGVNNLLDQDPPLVYNGFLGSSDASTYDYMGRYFYLRFTQAF